MKLEIIRILNMLRFLPKYGPRRAWYYYRMCHKYFPHRNHQQEIDAWLDF